MNTELNNNPFETAEPVVPEETPSADLQQAAPPPAKKKRLIILIAALICVLIVGVVCFFALRQPSLPTGLWASETITMDGKTIKTTDKESLLAFLMISEDDSFSLVLETGVFEGELKKQSNGYSMVADGEELATIKLKGEKIELTFAPSFGDFHMTFALAIPDQP